MEKPDTSISRRKNANENHRQVITTIKAITAKQRRYASDGKGIWSEK